MATHIFTDAERARAREVAEERARINRGRGIPDKRESRTQSSERIDVIGYLAEIAFAAITGARPVAAAIAETPETGPDFEMPSGKTVDVKGTDHPFGRLLLHRSAAKKQKAQSYALVYVTKDLSQGTLIGGVTHSRALEWWATDIPTPCYAVPRDELVPWQAAR